MSLPVDTVTVPFPCPPPGASHARSLRQLSYRLRVFDLAVGTLGPARGRRYVDLGAGPLLFAQRARDAGFAVTAVDARPPRLRTLPEGIAFVLQDVCCFPLDGHDVIGIVGLLYHLPLEAQIDLLSRCEGRPTIVDTEVWCADLVARLGLSSPRLAGTAVVAGYSGAVLEETGNVWSSYDNAQSFWLDEPSLLRLFAEAGWSRVTMFEPPYLSIFGQRRWYVLT